MTTRTLLLLRHAQAEATRPGHPDLDRRLTPAGEQQARSVGDFLRDEQVEIDRVLCSSAVRARQTLELLQLSIHDETDGVEFEERLYSAGTDTWIEMIRELDEDASVVLLVGHAPDLPGIAYELADPATSTREAFAAIENQFPAATLARLEFTGAWSELDGAALVGVRLPQRP